jgi:hypothetical protein
MDARIWNAASMFFASPTGRAARGPADVRAMAPKVVRKLRSEVVDDEVGFGKLDANTNGLSREGISAWGRNNVVVNDRLVNDLAATSIVLVHEAMHLVVDRAYVTEELWCRTLEILYFEDLTTGTWAYAQWKSGQANSVRLDPTRLNGYAAYIQVQQNLWAMDRLLDHILTMDEYSKSLKAGWIRDHFDAYGGIGNREPATKGLYVKVLTADGGVENARLVLRVLLSVARTPGNAAEWNAVVRAAGGIDVVRQAIRRLRTRKGTTTVRTGATEAEVRQIESLEVWWGVTF